LDLEISGLENLFEGDVDNAPILGGTVAGRVHEIPKVKDLIESIMEETNAIVKGLAKLVE